ILERKERVVAGPLSIYAPVVIAEGRGATITDVDGNTFLDFTGGVGCLNVGHSHPRVVEAAQAQLERFSHTDFTNVPYQAYVELAFTTSVAVESVAAIVIEPVQGEGGFLPAPPEFLAGVRKICDDNGIVLIVDEVQTGFGRTGKMFALEHYGLEADLLTVAKS